jgi:HNH endonuclease
MTDPTTEKLEQTIALLQATNDRLDQIETAIALSNKNSVTIQVDASDLRLLRQNKDGTWRFSLNSKGYACVSTPGEVQLIHRLILRPPAGTVVDHINSDKLDNRRCNLRICTVQESNQNRKAMGASPILVPGSISA